HGYGSPAARSPLGVAPAQTRGECGGSYGRRTVEQRNAGIVDCRDAFLRAGDVGAGCAAPRGGEDSRHRQSRTRHALAAGDQLTPPGLRPGLIVLLVSEALPSLRSGFLGENSRNQWKLLPAWRHSL